MADRWPAITPFNAKNSFQYPIEGYAKEISRWVDQGAPIKYRPDPRACVYAAEVVLLRTQMDTYMNTKQKFQTIAEFLRLCVVIALGFLGWAMVSAVAGWLASAFGQDTRLPVTYACIAIYIFIVISVFRRWRESRCLIGIHEETRGKYLETAWSLPLALVGALAVVGALFLRGWQIVFWLRTDAWVSLDIVSLMTPISGEPLGPRTLFIEGKGPSGDDWLIAPRDWYGLQKVAHFVSSMVTPSLILLIGGLTSLNKAAEYSDTRSNISAQSRASMPNGNDA